MTQNDALAILKTGRNVFVTGPAGSGKTHVINEYIKYLKDREVPMGITASTGIAATHLGGVTIHSWCGIGVKESLDAYDLEELSEKGYLSKRIDAAKVLIIDEISMLHGHRFDMVDQVLRTLKKVDLPFGGLQIVLCGDFFQLPPVRKMGEGAEFAYGSRAWKEGGFAVCYLSENYRQKDDLSVSVLNDIRSGEVSDESFELLKGRWNERSLADLEPTRLYTHNVDVDAVNDEELSKVPENEYRYEMKSKGKKSLVQALKNSCLAPETLRLRRGARVMCVKNNFDKGYVNGTLGVVVACGPDMNPVIRTAKGRNIEIEPATWVIDDNGKSLAQIVQYPLRLAWAITVHKSQGMSLDAVEVDLSKSFEPGMGYVALSRVRSLDGLTILGMNSSALMVHPEVLEYDRHLKELSSQLERELLYSGKGEIESLQNAFLAKVAPLHSLGKKTKSKKPSTFEKTAELIRKEKSLHEIAKARSLQVDSVIGQLEKMIEKKIVTLHELKYLKNEIPARHFEKIEKAFEELAENSGEDGILLSPVKNKVGFNISFRDIRLARVILGYSGKNKSQ